MKKILIIAALAACTLAACTDEMDIKMPKFKKGTTQTEGEGTVEEAVEEDPQFDPDIVLGDEIPEEETAVEDETSYVVRATVYNPEESQCYGDPLVTASMAHIDLEKLRNDEIRWCAVSRDLLEIYSYGDTLDVYISEGHRYNGRWVVQDTMNKRFSRCIDLLTYSTKVGRWDAIVTKS